MQAAIGRFCVTPRTNRPSRVRAISSATPASTSAANAMIAMRLNGSVRLLITLDAAGQPRRVLDRHVLRAEHRAHRLHQHQADAPGGEQRLERPAVEPADHAALEHRADQRRGQERDRDRDQHVGVEGAGQVRAEQVLHHVGRVGADHHQLAVRHVDDAHQAVGDRQAERDQQQDRAEADAGEDDAEALAPGEARLDRRQRELELRAHLGVGLDVGLQALEQQRLGGRRGCCRPAPSRPRGAWPCRRDEISTAGAQHGRAAAFSAGVGLGLRTPSRSAAACASSACVLQLADRVRRARATSGENSFSEASAASISRRMRLLLTTSSAPSGSVGSAPVAGVDAPCRRARRRPCRRRP